MKLKTEYKHTGKMIFDPKPLNGDVSMFKPYWSIIKTDDDFDSYYKWFLHKRYGYNSILSITDDYIKPYNEIYGLKLQKPAWGSHISVIRGEIKEGLTTDDEINEWWDYYKNKYNGKNYEFVYDLTPKTNGKHWWLKIYSDELTDLRKEMGLFKSDIGLHITLGMTVPTYLEQSFYLWDLVKKGYY